MTVKYRQQGNRSILLMMCLWFFLSRGETAEAAPKDTILAGATLASAIAQNAVSQAAMAQITNIRFQPGEAGLDLILETANGDEIQAFSSVDGNTLIFDLVNARLDIGAERYQADNPTEAISSLVVETLDEQSIRITLVGIETLPEANLAVTGEEFIVTLPSFNAIALDPQPEEPSDAIPNLADITNIQLQSISSGAELILETLNGDMIQPFSSVEGETLILDLINARLALPEGDRYSVENPIEEISSLTVETLDAQSIRITIAGIDTLPEVNLSTTGEEFIVDLPSAAAIANTQDSLNTSDSGTLRIGVTGEEETTSISTRTDTPILEVPASVQAIPREILQNQQVVDLGEALNNVSGVAVDTAEGRGFRINLRGFEGVSVFRDGFRLYSPNDNGDAAAQGFPEIANIERVEVLKGPASILFGQIEPGGTVNIVTKQPLDDPLYAVSLQGGSYGFFRPQIDFSGPLSEDETLRYRLNAVYQYDDGFRDFTLDTERFFIAPTLSWQIDDNTDFNFRLEYLDDQRPLDVGLVAVGTSVADIPYDRILGELDDRISSEVINVGYDFEHRFNDDWKIRNAFRYIRSEDDISAALSFPFIGGLNETTGQLNRVFGEQNISNETLALQTNVIGEFSTGAIDHTLLLGVDVARYRLESNAFTDFSLRVPIDIFNPVYGTVDRPARPTDPTSGETIKTDSLQFYLQDQIQLTDNLIVVAGFNYETISQNTTSFRGTTFSESTLDESAFSPRLGLVYQPVENVSLYANYSRSFYPSASTTADGEALEPERGQGFEVGVKAELFDGNLLATLAYFNLTKQNVATTDPDNPLFSVATGEQKSEGIELDLVGEIVPGWNVLASYAYIDAQITADNTFTVGNKLAGVPEHSASLWTTYEIQSGNLEGLGFGVGVNWVGDRQGDLNNSFTLDSYFLANAAIFYERDNWRFGLNFKNIFNTNYIVGTPRTRTRGIEPGDPFTVLGTIRYEF
ncbi:MAG: TonB-dependent siderophore receptor [Cyanobacteria bacterium P01_E01_bin.42]